MASAIPTFSCLQLPGRLTKPLGCRQLAQPHTRGVLDLSVMQGKHIKLEFTHFIQLWMWKEKSACSKSPLSSQCRQGKAALEKPFSFMAVKTQGSHMERTHSHTTWSSCWAGFAAISHLFCPLHNQDLSKNANTASHSSPALDDCQPVTLRRCFWDRPWP